MEVAARTSEELTESLDRTVLAMAEASAELLRIVSAYDASGLWERDGATSMTAWLAARYGMARSTAREWVRVARALRRLPRIAEAHRSGLLSWDQLRPLTRFATPETDEYWARRARELRPSTLWREAARHERATARKAEEAHRSRSFALWWDPERTLLYLEGRLGAEQGAVVEAALSDRAEEVARDPEAESPEDARMADALVELVTGGRSAAGGGPAATLVVHAGAEALAGQEPSEGPWLSETEDGRRLPTEAVRRLACDARVEWLLEREGRPVGIGRRGRTVPPHLDRILRHRDGGCRFPGCERTRWVHAHHLRHWGDGGRTDLDNLVLLCSTHHRLIHEGGWSISGDPRGHLRFHDPTGRPVPRSMVEGQRVATPAVPA